MYIDIIPILNVITKDVKTSVYLKLTVAMEVKELFIMTNDY